MLLYVQRTTNRIYHYNLELTQKINVALKCLSLFLLMISDHCKKVEGIFVIVYSLQGSITFRLCCCFICLRRGHWGTMLTRAELIAQNAIVNIFFLVTRINTACCQFFWWFCCSRKCGLITACIKTFSNYFSSFQDKLKPKQEEATETTILPLFHDGSTLASFAKHISEQMPIKPVFLITGALETRLIELILSIQNLEDRFY